MGKRKHKSRSRERIKNKIRRLEARLRDHDNGSTSSAEKDGSRAYSKERRYSSSSELHLVSDSDQSVQNVRLRSVIMEPSPEHEPAVEHTQVPYATVLCDEPSCSSAPVVEVPSTVDLPTDILAALGVAKGKPEILGPPIQEKVSELWGRILTEGLDKDLKLKLIDKILVPENFQLVKAPKLNPEIAAVLTDSARNRDKRLERAQQHLGLGIAEIANMVSLLIDRDMDKVEMIKKLSEINQIFLELHFENTVNRIKLINPSLDKKFLNIIQDVKRDKYLFGESLGERIKASKTAEKSGLQVKRPEPKGNISAKRYTSQPGNVRGPPRPAQRGGKPTGANHRPMYQSPRRHGQQFSRYQAPTKATDKMPSNKTR